MVVVILGPGKGTHSCQHIVVVVVRDIKCDSKVIVCKAINYGRDRHIWDLGSIINGIDEVVLEVFKVSLKTVAEGNVVYGDSRELEFLLGVGARVDEVRFKDMPLYHCQVQPVSRPSCRSWAKLRPLPLERTISVASSSLDFDGR
ncbi:hypothetical protein E2C01_032814 [Portunus trituberculatus]|uniref:Uncharacterized protein n=1 Tax=Portunus trituberculatus TaxID=210409 RepID=A0A5B7F3W7_PORTR|nr:hypothetical protein [Portunus trituberculatus]